MRQLVLSLPIPLRVLLAAQPEMVTPVLQVVQRVVTRDLLYAAQLEAGEGHGAVELKPKTPWCDGTTHLVMTPLEFIQRLAARVSRRRPLHFFSIARVARASDGIPPPNSEQRMSQMGRVMTDAPPSSPPQSSP